MYKSQFCPWKYFKKFPFAKLKNFFPYCLDCPNEQNCKSILEIWLSIPLCTYYFWFNYYWKFLTIISTFPPIRWCFSPDLTKVPGQSQQIFNVNKVCKSMWSASILTKLEKLLTIKDSEVLSFWNRSNLFFVLSE